MKKFMICLSIAFSSLNAFSFDMGSSYSNNLIKVDIVKKNELVRFSYCPEKTNLNSCKLLGKGIYRTSDLKMYRYQQMAKQGGRAVLGTAGIVVGVIGAGAGAVLLGPVGIPVLLASGTVFLGGAKLIESVDKNYQDANTMSFDLINDKYIAANTRNIANEAAKIDKILKKIKVDTVE